MCVLVCIGACIGLYSSLNRSVSDCIGLVLVNVLASVLARIEKQRQILGLYLHVSLFHTYQIPTQYMPIHADMHWYVLQYMPLRVQCIWHVLWYVLWYALSLYLPRASIIFQYVHNTNIIHTNTANTD